MRSDIGNIYESESEIFIGAPSEMAVEALYYIKPTGVTYKAALRFIEDNLEKAISLRDIADAVNMSPYHFCRLFKKECGYSPYEYLLMVRMNRAKHLLKTTDIPIKNVARQVGYLNASTFSSVFAMKVGVPPKTFREEMHALP